jgi:hypothetical protein
MLKSGPRHGIRLVSRSGNDSGRTGVPRSSHTSATGQRPSTMKRPGCMLFHAVHGVMGSSRKPDGTIGNSATACAKAGSRRANAVALVVDQGQFREWLGLHLAIRGIRAAKIPVLAAKISIFAAKITAFKAMIAILETKITIFAAMMTLFAAMHHIHAAMMSIVETEITIFVASIKIFEELITINAALMGCSAPMMACVAS